MKRTILLLIVFSAALSINQLHMPGVNAAQMYEDNSGAVLCSPAVYLQNPGDCVPLGPSQYLTDMARIGMELPLQPLQVSHPDPTLSNLPYNYYRIDPKTGTAFYPSLEAAIAKTGPIRVIPPGAFIYVVYYERLDTNRGTYFLVPSGAYMPGDGSTWGKATTFPGVEIFSTPRNSFAWVINPADVRREPNNLSYNQPIRQLKLYEIIQIYATQNIEGSIWYLIGPDEWVEKRYNIAVVTPNATPPAGVTNDRWIDVNLAEQTLSVYDKGQMVYATVITSGGAPFYTRPGLFQIYEKKELENMQGAFEADRSDFYYLENVPWTMYFDKARALHGAYWRTKFGYTASHGCVNLSIGDAHWLYNWASEGDWVYVHDPSGETPTDPSYYGDGGA